jgi:GNAT superfamily N-acetyltransferase
MNSLLIREMRHDDVPATAGFPPPEWNFDATSFFAVHFGRSYFHPIVAETDGALAGIANALIFGGSAWLGNIIVAQEFRRRGIGESLTGHLMDFCRRRGCRTQILIATPLGRPVYQKCGFVQTGEYVFLKPGHSIPAPDMSPIRCTTAGDNNAIAALDRQVTAEDRRAMMLRFVSGGFVHLEVKSGQVDGFYLPSFGQGPVIAANDSAGFSLLQLKHNKRESTACLPAGNTSAIGHLLSLGFAEDHRAPRMALGGDVPWRQDMIFARGAGYCG